MAVCLAIGMPIFRSSLQMIRQSQIRNFISLITRKNLETATSLPDAKPALHKLQLSTQSISKCKRYETEPIHDQTLQNSLSYQGRGFAEETNKQYIKLSLYQKYRRSLQAKVDQIALKTECVLEMQKDKKEDNNSKEMIFPINRPTQRPINKQTPQYKQRVLSTPSHLYSFCRQEKAEKVDEQQKRMPTLLPENSAQGGQQAQCSYRPIFKVKKYHPLNVQSQVDQAHRVFIEESKPQFQNNLYLKLKSLQQRRLRQRIKLGEKRRREKCEVTEVLQQSISGWIMDKGKSRCEYELI